MVVGRAVNGSWSECTADEADPEMRREAIDDAIKRGQRLSRCPMLWVTGQRDDPECKSKYNPKRSAFWRVICAVVRDLAIADVGDPRWPSSLVWTNLYKLAPASGGNAHAALRQMQSAECLDLLKLEIAEWKPRRILMLTGIGWGERLLDRLQAVRIASGSRDFVDFVGSVRLGDDRSTEIVVAKHPQCKPQGRFVEDVVAAFSAQHN
jgi:hypothetical protein